MHPRRGCGKLRAVQKRGRAKMKTFTVQLFRRESDDEPAQEWAVIAESVDEAKQALREHFGDPWTWPRIDVAEAKTPVDGPAGVIGQVPISMS